MKNGKKRIKYSRDLPRRLYSFFKDWSDGTGAPSVEKFAISIGATLSDVERFRSHVDFERAWRECSEIRRDYLTDMALTRRFDPSFVKFLLTEETEDVTDTGIDLRLEVIER